MHASTGPPAEPGADPPWRCSSGLLSHIGLRDARPPRLPRRARRAVRDLPGLGAGAEAAGLGDGGRARRDVAAVGPRRSRGIDPQWIEPLAGHLVRAHATASRAGTASAASVVATERVTLYGLPIVAGPHGRLRADRPGAVARAVHPPRAGRGRLGRRATRSSPRTGALRRRGRGARGPRAAARHPRRRRGAVRLLRRARSRRTSCRRRALRPLVARRAPRPPGPAARTRASCSSTPDAADALDPRARPDGVEAGRPRAAADATASSRARADDGVTVHVPLTRARRSCGRTASSGSCRRCALELVTALLRALPKELRRPLVPVPDVAAEVLARLRPRREPLLDALARELEARARRARPARRRGTSARLPAAPAHDVPRSRTSRGACSPRARTSTRCARRSRPRLRAELTARRPELERTGADGVGRSGRCRARSTLPGTRRCARLPGAGRRGRDGRRARARDAGGAGRRRCALGTRRLLLADGPVAAAVRPRPAAKTRQLALAGAPHGSVARGARGRATAAIDALVARGRRPGVGRGRLPAAARRTSRASWPTRTTADRRRRSRGSSTPRARSQRRLEPLTRRGGAAGAPRRRARSSAGSSPRASSTASGAARLRDVERYLQRRRAAARAPARRRRARDLDRMRAVHELEALYRRAARRVAARAPAARALREVPWMLEELRVSHFAQGLGTRGPVSSKRIRRVIEEHAPRP